MSSFCGLGFRVEIKTDHPAVPKYGGDTLCIKGSSDLVRTYN